jgi:predicted metal-dependent hydrolase
MSTPLDLAITPRNISFAKLEQSDRWWLGGDPIATAFYNALSVTFPQGERFFMDAVRRYRDETDGKLAEQVAAFLTQEALHTREHVAFNKQVGGQGYDIAALETRTKGRLDFARSRHPRLQLGATIALEHFTAVLAHALLADPRHLEGASADARDLWRWHAIEEIEHKSVAFDTFMVATRYLSGFRRWHIRVWTMIMATLILHSVVSQNMRDLLAHDGLRGWKVWRGVMAFLWKRPGMLGQALKPYFAYFVPGFHPWDGDDRALIRNTERELAAAYPLAAAS